MTFFTITTGNAASGSGVATTAPSSNVNGGPAGMPAVVLASELYFWSAKWQAQEREFETARERGELIEAASMDEVIRDLMRVDPEDC